MVSSECIESRELESAEWGVETRKWRVESWERGVGEWWLVVIEHYC